MEQEENGLKSEGNEWGEQGSREMGIGGEEWKDQR